MHTMGTTLQMNELVNIIRPNKRPTIGYLTSSLSDDNVQASWFGAEDATLRQGCNLICFVGGLVRDPRGFQAQNNVLYDLVNAEILDGLVSRASLIGTYLNRDELVRFHRRYSSLPMVSVGTELEGVPYVFVDGYQGMYAMVTHLIQVHGYRRLAFIRGPEHAVPSRRRYNAYLDALKEHGIPVDEELITPPGLLEKSAGVEAVRLLLDERRLQPRVNLDAIIAAQDQIALGAIEELQARGIRIPQDVAVTGYTDIKEGRVTAPALTSVAVPYQEQEWQAIEILLAQLRGESVPEKTALLPRLVVRQSCGCLDPMLVGAAVEMPRQPEANIPFHVAFAAQREQIIADVAQTVKAYSANLETGWVPRLIDSFITDWNGKSSGAFLSVLDESLRAELAAGKDVAGWQAAISTLRRHAISCIGPGDLLRAENLWGQARVLIGQAAQRAQALQTILVEQQVEALRQVSSVLASTLRIPELTDALARELPRLGIPSVYLSLYENPLEPAKWSRLILAYNETGRIALEPEGQRFPSRQLVPQGMLPQGRRYSFVVEPLYFQKQQLGFILFEVGPRDGALYESLRGQISSALQGNLLMQQVQERSAELARQQYILDTFMENVPDRIYFKDLEGRITKANKAHAARLGLSDPSEEIGKTDFDFFSPEQAQAKYEQEQQIIRTGQPISLEEKNVRPNGQVDWSLTTKMPLRDERGNIIGTFGISRDITDVILSREAAMTARDEAEKARREAEAANQALAAQMWQIAGLAQLNDRMRGEQDIPTLANNVIQHLCEYLNAQVGTLYLLEDDVLKLVGTYAYSHTRTPPPRLDLGESLVGQAALEKKPLRLTNVPPDYFISSSLGQITPRNIFVVPFTYEDHTIGVIELGTLTDFSPDQSSFLNKAMENVAVAFVTAQARARVNDLLAQTQRQAEELQAQEEELRAANEQLEAKTKSLQASEVRLRTANAELEEKAAALQEQRALLDRQNRELKIAQLELQRKAEELALASKYKSEFLSNMSHELRTPLNSILILASMLAKNEHGNLTPDQIEAAQIIYAGGTDLLNLINDILDLSKVEAGRMEFRLAPMPVQRLIDVMRAQFTPLAEKKHLDFQITLADDAPTTIVTDQQRLEQIIKNLLSNAIKFTDEGFVRLSIYRPGPDVDLSQSGLDPARVIAFSVADSGIGMSPEQQKIVFEAFRQADGSISRQYGGTGLGLTISRELATRLGGQITLVSELGKGSTFTLYLPIEAQLPGEPHTTNQPPPAARLTSTPIIAASPPAQALPDDRDAIQMGDRILLIIEDDPAFAKIVYDYAHKKSWRCLLAADGETGLQLVNQYKPHAIVLDINLPGMSGWEVLDTLKTDSDTRHIPVHIISVSDQDLTAYKRGAMGFLSKPVSPQDLERAFQNIEEFIARKIKSLLLVEDDENLRKSIIKLLEGSDVSIRETGLGQTALDLLVAQHFDCMILDLNLPDMSGFELLSRLDADDRIPKCPVIVYTGKALSEEENRQLLQYADSVIVKGVKSPERLLDETALFLHRVVADMPEDKQRTIRRLHDREAALSGKHILIVDDDARNAFALSRLLADKGLQVHIAPNGPKALEILNKTPIDLVLMDIMLPDMDGYEVTRRIRAQARFHQLPILALTAKAMKGDREKCIAAGANDYLPKPVDADRLFSMLRVWLSKE